MATKGTDDIRVGILVASDAGFFGKGHGDKGDNLEEMIESRKNINGTVVVREFLPDDHEQIKAKLLLWCDYLKLDLILTTGGTGFSARDVTPEATKAVIEKEAPGMSLAMLQGSLKITHMAMLSRPVCGIRGKTLIINLPGSPKGVAECFLFVCPSIPHAVDLLRGKRAEAQKTCKSLLAEGVKHPHHSGHQQPEKNLNQLQFKGVHQGIQNSPSSEEFKSKKTLSEYSTFSHHQISEEKSRNDRGFRTSQMRDTTSTTPLAAAVGAKKLLPSTFSKTVLISNHKKHTFLSEGYQDRLENFANGHFSGYGSTCDTLVCHDHSERALSPEVSTKQLDSHFLDSWTKSDSSVTSQACQHSVIAISEKETRAHISKSADLRLRRKPDCLEKKYGKGQSVHQTLPSFKLMSPSKEIHVLSKEEEERPEMMTLPVDDGEIEMKSKFSTNNKTYDMQKVILSKESNNFETLEMHTNFNSKVALKRPQTDNSDPLHSIQSKKFTIIKQSTKEPTTLQVQQERMSSFAGRNLSNCVDVNTSRTCHTPVGLSYSTTPKLYTVPVKAAKIYKCKQGGEISHPCVGSAVRTFFAKHPLIQGIRLHKGKRQVKRKLVQLCHSDDNLKAASSCTASQLSSALTPKELINNNKAIKPHVAKQAPTKTIPLAAHSFHITSPLTGESELKKSPKKWRRGKDLLERNSLEDSFILTKEGKSLLDEVKAGHARDQYVVNWYMWCPGRTNCLRKCGGFGKCIAGCQGMRHKQDRHYCRLMVNLKLFLSDLHHWRVHITGSHVPPGASVKWIPSVHIPYSSTLDSCPEHDEKGEKQETCFLNVSEPEKFLSEENVDFENQSTVKHHNGRSVLSRRLESNKNNLHEEILQNSLFLSKTVKESKPNQATHLSNVHNVSFNEDIQSRSTGKDRSVSQGQNVHYDPPCPFSIKLDASEIETLGLKSKTSSTNPCSLADDMTASVKDDEQNRDMAIRTDPKVSLEQSTSTTLIPSNPHCQVSEASLAHVIPSKKRISKMLSKLKRHRMKRGNLHKNPFSRFFSKSESKVLALKPLDRSVRTLNVDLNKLESPFVIHPPSNMADDISNAQTLQMSNNTGCSYTGKVAEDMHSMAHRHCLTHAQSRFVSSQPKKDIIPEDPANLSSCLEPPNETEINTKILTRLNQGSQSILSAPSVLSSQSILSNSLPHNNFIADIPCSSVTNVSMKTSPFVTNMSQIPNKGSQHKNPVKRAESLWVINSNTSQVSSEKLSLNQISSLHSQDQHIQEHKPSLSLPLHQSNNYGNHYWALQEEEIPGSLNETVENYSQSPSLLPWTTNLHGLQLQCSATDTPCYNEDINTFTTPFYQIGHEHNYQWSETHLMTHEALLHSQEVDINSLSYALNSRYEPVQGNGEHNQHPEMLPSYQEAASLLATQFNLSN